MGNGKAWLAGLALAALVVVFYVPVSWCGFIWDDDHYVEENPYLRDVSGLSAIWLEPGATPQYYPLVFTTFWVEYSLWELRPAGYHLVNVVLHAGGTVLLWLVLRRLNVPGAWVAAAVFGLHPVHVESVAWVTERKNVLSGLFFFASLLAYLQFNPLDAERAEAPSGRWWWYALAFVLFVAALLSKTVTCSLPAVLVLLVWWKRGHVRWDDVWPLLPLFAAGLAGGLLTAWLEKAHVGARGEEWNFSVIQRVLIAGRALWFYAWKLVWPAQLTFMYPRWEVSGAVWWQYLFPLGALAVVAVLWFWRGLIGRGPLVGVLCFAGGLVPALGFFDVYPFRYSFVADHFQYLPSAALIAVLVGVVASSPWMRGAGGWGAAGVVLLVLGCLTWRQIAPYLGVEELWLDTIKKNPSCWMAHNNLANKYLEREDLAAALKHSKAAVMLEPQGFEPWATYGNVLLGMGRVKEAEAHLRKVAKRFRDNPDAHGMLGHVLAMQRRDDEAIACFRRALAIDPNSPEANLNIGTVLLRKGQVEQAVRHLEEAAKLRPDNPEAYFHLGMARLALKGAGAALPDFEKAVKLQPDQPQYRFALALAYQQAGQPKKAREQCRETLRRGGAWHQEGERVAWAMATNPDGRTRNGPLAEYLARALVLATRGTRPKPFMVLAAAYAEMGEFDKAKEAARKALGLVRDSPGQSGEALEREVSRHLESYERGEPVRQGK